MSTSITDCVELCERGARERPGDPALIYFETVISQREAAELAHALAAGLREELGLAPGDRVALMLQNVPAMAIAAHAVWLAGGVLTTLNPMYRRAELEHQIGDAGAAVVICLESLHEVVAEAREAAGVRHVVTVSELEMLDQRPPLLADHQRLECPGATPLAELLGRHAGARVRPHEPGPEDPALLTYTSGTTGVSKGAVNTHRAVVENAATLTGWYGLGPGDVTVALAPLFHITGLICHLATSRYSLTPLLLSYRFDPGELLRLIERWRGSWAIGPLTAYIAMLEHPQLGERDLSSLTKVASGGAAVNPATVARWEEKTGSYVHNAYGLTETAAPTHLVPLGTRAPVDPDSGALSIGVPIGEIEARIVDVASGAELGPEEIGEIVLRGPTVTPGYWRRPEETAEALRGGWLHTGDVGKRDAEGWFYVVDRIKDMIVASGFKVWPRDVEDVLFRHPAVREASVIGVPDDYRGESVRAYVALREGAASGEAELIEHCRAELAAYKAPREVVFVEEIPKTLSGKALRRELRERARLSP